MKIKILSSLFLLIVGFVIGFSVEWHYVNTKCARDARLHEVLAIQSRHEGAISNAINNYYIAKYIDPKNPQYDFELGRIYNDLGLYDIAHDEFAQALLRKDNIADNKFHYALIYCDIGSTSLDRGDYETMNAAFNASLELYPSLPEELLATYNRHKSDDKAQNRIEVYKKCLEGLKAKGYLKD